jgi:hypothetical protein
MRHALAPVSRPGTRGARSGGPATTRSAKGEAASEYGAFAPKGTVSRKAQTPGKGDEDPVPASSGAQPTAKFNSSHHNQLATR